MRRLAWTFAARIGDKYQIRLTRSTCEFTLLAMLNSLMKCICVWEGGAGAGKLKPYHLPLSYQIFWRVLITKFENKNQRWRKHVCTRSYDFEYKINMDIYLYSVSIWPVIKVVSYQVLLITLFWFLYIYLLSSPKTKFDLYFVCCWNVLHACTIKQWIVMPKHYWKIK